MRRSALTERGELTRQGYALALRSLVLAGLLVALGFAVGQPVPAIAFALAALAIPAVGVAYLRRRARDDTQEPDRG